MAHYLYLGRYSGTGRAGLIAEGGTKREAETRAFFEKVGGKVHQYLFAMGEFDFIIVAELPDDDAALLPPMVATSTGTVSVTTVKLLTPSQMDGISAKARNLSFRAAGS